jgi:hypothetical protein
MSTHLEVRRNRFSPGLLALVGMFVMAGAFMVDVSTDWTSARASEVRAVEQPAD